jgi:amino acid adenylation domain-containing protein
VTVSSADLLGDLEGRGVRLYLADGQMRALAPKNVLTDELRQQIKEQRDELIDLLRKRASLESLTVAPPIGVVGRDGVLPLSFAQQRLWFLQQLDPASVEYNMPMPVWWEGDLDVGAVGAALSALLERHEVLRTRLVVGEDGVAAQVIDPPAAVDLPLVDVSGEADPTEAARALIAQDGAVPFDLAAGPLLRARLVRVSAREHVLALCLHHVVFDEWSAGILRRELGEFYEAFRDGREPVLPALPVQYADFAVWQREWLTGEVLDGQLEYWRERLAGAPVLELPTDRPRPPVRSTVGESIDFVVPGHVAEGLRALARTARASMFMTLLGAFSVLLGAYSGQDDVVVGTPIANRNRRETEGLIGFFVNTLVLRTDLSGDPTFAELLSRVRDVALGAYAHQDVPFETVVDASGTQRDRSRTPLFQVIFNYTQNGPAPDGEQAPANLDGGGDDVDSPVPVKFDLAMAFGETGDGGLAGGMQYATSLFDRDRMRRMVGHLLVLLEAVAADPQVRLSRLSVLTAAERAQLNTWNDTAVAVPAAAGVHELVTVRAGQHPDVVAVRSGGVSLTYRGLEEHANRLARHLRAVGVRRESVVGLCLPRGVDLVVAVLAVWKAGGAYVPLDPQYPADRLRFMLADSGARLLVGTAATLASLPDGTVPGEVTVLPLDDAQVRDAVARQSVEPPRLVASPQQAAYIIYTSGSTGRPKGVQVAHHGVVNLATALRPFLGISEGTVALQFASFSFDAAVLDLAVVLAGGGTLAIATEAEKAEPAALSAMINDSGVGAASVVPSLVAVLDPDAVPGVGNWVVGAERLTAELARTWATRTRLVNTYGPTETTVIATAVPLTVDPDSDPRRDPLPPIGAPIANTRIHVLDAQLRPVPAGVPGEVFIGGAGVARGYHHRPALTARQFIPDPFSGDGSRLYRSGDLARWRPDGQLEFLGRADHQVKVRGFRIEPGEIEHTLRAHPGISAAVITADGEAEDRRLIAYLVPANGDGPPPVTGIRDFLRERLPEFMIPAVFIPLKELPLGPNGKLDRGRLPTPDGPRLGPTVYQPPRNATEELLTSIWAELLKLDRVGTTDNFFELGGHSLLATQVMSRVRTVFGVEIPLATLFDHPTIAELAEIINQPILEAGGDQEGLEEFEL